jgi:ketosteroid isomerase-like protein
MTGNADREKAESYYRYVDNEEYESVFELFADDIRYVRSGPRVIDGIEEFESFYRGTRPLRGTHTVESMVENEDVVAVHGRFKGKNVEANEEMEFGFADFLYFNDNGEIYRRHTFNNMLQETL